MGFSTRLLLESCWVLRAISHKGWRVLIFVESATVGSRMGPQGPLVSTAGGSGKKHVCCVKHRNLPGALSIDNVVEMTKSLLTRRNGNETRGVCYVAKMLLQILKWSMFKCRTTQSVLQAQKYQYQWKTAFESSCDKFVDKTLALAHIIFLRHTYFLPCHSTLL